MSGPVEIIGFMRFSVVLESAAKWGWRATCGRTLDRIAATILHPKRIEARLSLARAVPIASLDGQGDRDFLFNVLTSTLLAEPLKRKLAALAAGHPFVRIVEVAPSASLRAVASGLTPADRPCITFRLDDDDAVGPHFIADLRSLAVPANEERVLSFPEGVYMARRGGRAIRNWW